MKLEIFDRLLVFFDDFLPSRRSSDGRNSNDDDESRPCVGMIENKNDHHRGRYSSLGTNTGGGFQWYLTLVPECVGIEKSTAEIEIGVKTIWTFRTGSTTTWRRYCKG